MRRFVSLLAILVGGVAQAEVKTVKIQYTHDNVTLVGLMAMDDSIQGKRPGVLVFHEWWGLDDFAKTQAEKLAKMGYVAFAADMYGAGKVVDHPKDSAAMSGAVRKNQAQWRGRAQAALNALQGFENVDRTKIAAIGYCFGGSTALQLALSGADLKAVSTFHAGLPKVTADEAKQIKAKVLVSNGAADTFVPAPVIAQFNEAVQAAGVEYEFDNYPGVVHSFAVPGAAEHNLPGMAYNADADAKSWAKTKALFERVFAK